MSDILELNDLSLPVKVKNNSEYINKVKRMYDKLKEQVEKYKGNGSELLQNKVNNNCDIIISILEDFESEEGIKEAVLDKKIETFLSRYIHNEFIVADLDKNYAFRGVAVCECLKSTNVLGNIYKDMLNDELSFFRARVVEKNEKLSECKNIISLPYSRRELSAEARFSNKNEICLYLGVTSYVCSLECQYEEGKNLYLSAFKFDAEGKKLKILNLVVSQGLCNGAYFIGDGEENLKLRDALVEIFPLVIATSFVIEQEERNIKFEYLLSQSIIRILGKLRIDGVAYLSKRGKDDLQYPHGVNLAIPMRDIGKEKEYSDLYTCMSCTKPVLFGENMGKCSERSYINKNYPKYTIEGRKEQSSIINVEGKDVFYSETNFSKMDDCLVNKKFYELDIVVKK